MTALPPLPNRLLALVGRERSLNEVSQALYAWARSLGPSATGALHVTCADETEHECSDAFQNNFVRYLLPPLKFARQSAMRLANIGGQYQWGAVGLGAHHFLVDDGSKRNLFVIKVNSHVSFETSRDMAALSSSAAPPPTAPTFGAPSSAAPSSAAPFRFGRWRRYGTESACCGALDLLLRDPSSPLVAEMQNAFTSEGNDRLAALRDPERVAPLYAPLLAGIVSARLQARKAVLDVQELVIAGSTLFAILPCVTLNRHERDTEIIAGIYLLHAHDKQVDGEYSGLGDDASAYQLDRKNGFFILSDANIGNIRSARNHRQLVLEAWQRQSHGTPATSDDPRLQRIRADVQSRRHHNHAHAKALLRAALPIFAEVAPVPAAVLAFTTGALGIHHAFRVHRLARDLKASEEARAILDEMHSRIDGIDPDRAAALLELLVAEYHP